MNRTISSNPENQPPHHQLTESVDYFDRSELHVRVVDLLQRCGIAASQLSEVLLCGYNGAVNEETPRTGIAAMTVGETTEMIQDGLAETPYQYAEAAFEVTGGRPFVAAYDPTKFVVEPDSAYGYTLAPDLTLGDATILTVELSQS